MTSKQALDTLFNSNENNYHYRNEYDIIEQDLEVLEIIKKKVLSIDMFYQNAQTLTTEELNLIKEWLER